MPRLLVPALLLLVACGPTARGVRFGARIPSREKTCDLRVYAEGEEPMDGMVIGRVEAERKSGADAVDAMLREQACVLGADAIMKVDIRAFPLPKEELNDDREAKLVADGAIWIGEALAVVVRNAKAKKSPPTYTCPVAPPPKPCPEKVCPECASCPVCAAPPALDVMELPPPPEFDPRKPGTDAAGYQR